MFKKKVFVSLDYDNDRKYRHIIETWSASPNFSFVFRNETPGVFNSWTADRIKAELATTIRSTSHTLVIVGEYANKLQEESTLIGYRNWMNFEIDKSKENGNRIVAVKLGKAYSSPDQLFGNGIYLWAWAFTEEAFTEEAILQALMEA